MIMMIIMYQQEYKAVLFVPLLIVYNIYYIFMIVGSDRRSELCQTGMICQSRGY